MVGMTSTRNHTPATRPGLTWEESAKLLHVAINQRDISRDHNRATVVAGERPRYTNPDVCPTCGVIR